MKQLASLGETKGVFGRLGEPRDSHLIQPFVVC
jgi:hypothetical protein